MSISGSVGCAEPVFTGKAIFRTNCPTLTDQWPASEKAEMLFDTEAQ